MDWKIIIIMFTNLTLVIALKTKLNIKNNHIWKLMFIHGVCYGN